MTGIAPPVTSAPRRGDGVRGRLRDWGPPALLLVAFLVVWELFVQVSHVKQFILPGPIAIFVAWQTYLPELVDAAGYTFLEILGGMIIGSTAGIVVGAVTARYRSMQDSLMPFAVAASSVPILAFAPLFNNWFGLDNQLSKAMIAAALCFFPVMINTVRGLTNVDPAAVELLRSLAASETQVFRKLRVPNSLPYVFTALRLAATLATIGAVVGEYFAAPTLQPRPVHRHLFRVPQLRAVVGRHRLRLRDRDRPVRPGLGRGVAGHALGPLEARVELTPNRHPGHPRLPVSADGLRSLDCDVGGGGPAPGRGP